MKRFITYAMCATLVAAGGYAADRVAVEKSPVAAKMSLFKQDASATAVGKKKVRKVLSAAKPVASDAKVNRLYATDDATPVEAPFVSPIDSEEELLATWNIIDGNKDGKIWMFYDYIELGRTVAIVDYNSTEAANDYMVTKQPVSMTAGEAYISLDYGAYGGYYESMELLYGTTDDVSQMTKIAEYIDFSDEELSATEAFDVPADGNYYFAIHGISQADQFALWVDNIVIDNGKPAPDLAVTGIDVVSSGPSLTASEPVSVTVHNNGIEEITSYSLTLTVAGDGGEVAGTPEVIDEPLAAGESRTVQLSATADLSAIGSYAVTVSASDVASASGIAETMTVNNSISTVVAHMGITDVPFSTDFATGEHSDAWTSDGSWIYIAENEAIGCGVAGELASMGVNLTAGSTYRISYNYYGGYMDIIPEYYTILCGKAGEDKEPVFQGEANTGGMFVEGEIDYVCTESGVYQFAFAQDAPYGTFFLSSINITAVSDYDLAITAVGGYPTMLPTSQASEVPMTVTIANEGLMDAGGSIAVSINGSQVAQLSLPAAVEAGTAVAYSVSVPLTGVEAGSDATVGLSVAMDGQTDAVADNNSAEVKIAITDDVLAYDQTTEDMFDEMYAVGSEYGEIMAATSIHLSAAAKLTGITIGWAAIADEPNVTLAVYKYDADNLQTVEDYYGTYQYYALGDEMFSTTTEQGSETGWVNYEIEPVELEPGDYLLCTAFTGFAIACDMTESGIIYTVDTSYGEVYPQSGLGAPAIRAVLESETSGVDDVASAGSSLTLYPNPASETVVIAGQGVTGADFYSMAGVQVGSAAASAAGEVRYDVSSLAPGIYVAKIATPTGVEVKRFIVK